MRILICFFLALVGEAVLVCETLAHPGSGIVVDAQGQVFFQESAARTIWKIDTHGKITAHHDRLGGHWMALDTKNSFAKSDLKLVERISIGNAAPALLVADGGAPIAVNSEGALYYGLSTSESGAVAVGLTKILPNGTQEPFSASFATAIEKLGVTGLASGPDGTIYAACLTGVIKVRTNGTFTTLAEAIAVSDCDSDAPTAFLRGLDVDRLGNVYVAATGCRCLVKIASDGKIEAVLRAERPWSPTGVAVHGDDIYVLEYTNANGGLAEGWLPRVRKRAHDGKVSTLVTISAAQQRAQPNRLIVQPGER